MIKHFPEELNEGDIIELCHDPQSIFVCNDKCEIFDDIIRPDGYHEFNQNEVSRIWELSGDEYLLTYENMEAFFYNRCFSTGDLYANPSRTLIDFRFVGERDLIYWVERDNDNEYKYIIREGYYLASYHTGELGSESVKHVVSLDDITNCITRHIPDGDVFITKEGAKKRADELNKIRGKQKRDYAKNS